MIKKTDYSFASCDDRHTTIHAVRWEPEVGNISAAIQLVHGMQEHIERYTEFAEYLAGKGFAVFGHDHIGHGDSVEKDEPVAEVDGKPLPAPLHGVIRGLLPTGASVADVMNFVSELNTHHGELLKNRHAADGLLGDFYARSYDLEEMYPHARAASNYYLSNIDFGEKVRG